MSDKLIINLKQKKGPTNTVRLFFNHDLLDEFDTTESAEIKNYEVDIIDGDINCFLINVLSQDTVVEVIKNNNILSSNAVVINEMKIHYVKHDTIYDNKYPMFKRKIDPVYQIYAKQNNLEYNVFNKFCDVSIGNGYFAWFFVPMHYYREGLKDPSMKGWYNGFDWNPIERDRFYFGWDTVNNTDIFKDKIFEHGNKKISDVEIVDFLKEAYKGRLCDNIKEDIGINILRMCKFYED